MLRESKIVFLQHNAVFVALLPVWKLGNKEQRGMLECAAAWHGRSVVGRLPV